MFCIPSSIVSLYACGIRASGAENMVATLLLLLGRYGESCAHAPLGLSILTDSAATRTVRFTTGQATHQRVRPADCAPSARVYVSGPHPSTAEFLLERSTHDLRHEILTFVHVLLSLLGNFGWIGRNVRLLTSRPSKGWKPPLFGPR